jgi:hypothetical protein
MRGTARGPALFAGSVIALAASMGALAAALHGDDQFTRALAACSAAARMPGYAVPAGVASLLLMALAVALVLLARRQRAAPDADPWWRVLGAALAVLGLVGVLFTAYFGVVTVVLDMGDKQHCFG